MYAQDPASDFSIRQTAELLGGRTNFVGEVDGLLVDEELFELESHSAAPGEESRAVESRAVESRAVESRPSREEKVERP